jgi:hypothetical protein
LNGPPCSLAARSRSFVWSVDLSGKAANPLFLSRSSLIGWDVNRHATQRCQNTPPGEGGNDMWSNSNEEVRLASRALLQAAATGPVSVKLVGRSHEGPVYRVTNCREDERFSLEALRRAALISSIRFALEK